MNLWVILFKTFARGPVLPWPDMKKTEQEESTPPATPLVEGVDYYLEKGYWVLTEHFLRKRGYCCGSGCRHCPYRKKR